MWYGREGETWSIIQQRERERESVCVMESERRLWRSRRVAAGGGGWLSRHRRARECACVCVCDAYNIILLWYSGYEYADNSGIEDDVLCGMMTVTAYGGDCAWDVRGRRDEGCRDAPRTRRSRRHDPPPGHATPNKKPLGTTETHRGPSDFWFFLSSSAVYFCNVTIIIILYSPLW